MKFEINLTSGDLAWAMKDSDPEEIVDFIRDFLDHEFTKAHCSDIVQWLVNALTEDLENAKNIKKIYDRPLDPQGNS